jgi:hypothetical protein
VKLTQEFRAKKAKMSKILVGLQKTKRVLTCEGVLAHALLQLIRPDASQVWVGCVVSVVMKPLRSRGAAFSLYFFLRPLVHGKSGAKLPQNI